MRRRRHPPPRRSAIAHHPARSFMTSEASPSRRPRQRGVRSTILELLAAGPLSSQQLLDRAGCSPASLYLNLKALKADGHLDTTREGRTVAYQLRTRAGAVAVASRPARGRPARSRPDAGAADLDAALRVLLAQLSPIDNAADKIRVLTRLAASLPAPVSHLLQAVADDLTRLTGKG